MENIRIGARLLLGFGAVVLLTIFLGLYAVDRQQALQTLAAERYARDFLAMQTLQSIERGQESLRSTRRAVMLSAFLVRERQAAESPEVLERQWAQLRDDNRKSLADLGDLAAKWEIGSLTEQRAASWRRIHARVADAGHALQAIGPEAERIFALVNAGNLNAAAAELPPIERLAADYQNRLADARQAVQDQIDLGREQVAAISNQAARSVIFVLLVTVAASFVFAYFIRRSITQPLNEFAGVIERVGQGDLRPTPPVGRRDEIGDLGRNLGRMVTGLKELANQTSSVAASLNTATAEILASTQQQSAGTAEQAAAVQQANATMAEISQSGAQISDRAKQVAASAEAASSASASGMHSVRSSVSAMESIREQAEAVASNIVLLSEKTQAVGEIVQSVNDIAEQSHLLSLNASIQAAVAGEQGRSFSVVASEMKNLAAQSKQATVQVRSILGDIQKGITGSVMLTEEAVKRVESGRKQAATAENTIRGLNDSIEESVRAFQQIVGGSSQQQIGFEQVTQAFRNIGIASQQTASSTKQLEKAAANLSTLAQQLGAAVERYKV